MTQPCIHNIPRGVRCTECEDIERHFERLRRTDMTLQGFDINKAVDALIKKDIAKARAARLRLLADYLEHHAENWCTACVDADTIQLSGAVTGWCQARYKHG
ncbi:MAG: hypothetical protein V3W51_04675 [Candidatus Brocadiales bacterium]